MGTIIILTVVGLSLWFIALAPLWVTLGVILLLIVGALKD